MATTNALNSQVTSSNLPSTIVKRDSSGNFSAGTITANVTGDITGAATKATHVATTTNASFYPLLVSTSINGSDIFNLASVFSVNASTGLVQTGNINSSSLTASRIVFTDGSKTYTSSPPAIPQSVMLTNQTSYTANGILFQNSAGNAFSTASALTFNGADSLVLSSGNGSSEIVSKNLNGGGGAEARIIIDRNGGGGNSGYAQLRYSTNSSTVWEVGIRDSTTNYTIRGGAADRVTLTTGGTLTLNGGPFVQGNFSDADKFQLMGSTNAAKIAHGSSWNFASYAGAFTSAGGAINTGQFNWYTVDGTGSAFAQRMNLGNDGTLTLVTGDFIESRSSTGTVLCKVFNTNNATSGSKAEIQAIVGGASGGDPVHVMTISGVQDWAIGIDNSASDKFVICASDTPGSLDKLEIEVSTSDIINVAGNEVINTAGKTLKIKQGSNACAGTGAVLVGGTVTVNTTAVATGDIILLNCTAAGGTQGIITTSISNGTSFTLTSSSGTDTSTYSWVIIKAA